MRRLAVLQGGVRLATSFAVGKRDRTTMNELAVGLGALADGKSHASLLVSDGFAPGASQPFGGGFGAALALPAATLALAAALEGGRVGGGSVVLVTLWTGAFASARLTRSRRGTTRGTRTRLEEIGHYFAPRPGMVPRELENGGPDGPVSLENLLQGRRTESGIDGRVQGEIEKSLAEFS